MTDVSASEALLRHLDQMIMERGGWDLPPQLFIVTDDQKLGLVLIDESFHDHYPDPVELINVLAELQRAKVNELKQTGRTYTDINPELMQNGRPVAVIGIIESWGMYDEQYREAVRQLPAAKILQLMTEHGYIPMQDLPGAREQRNLIAVNRDLSIDMLTRYREPEGLEFVSERDENFVARGRLNESLTSFLGAILASYPPEE